MREGVARYHAAVAKAQPGQAPAELDLATTLMVKLVPAIREAQQGVLTFEGKNRPRWAFPLLYLAPEKLAVITIKSVLVAIVNSGTLHKQVTSLAIEVASHVRQERHFELWREAQGKSEGTNFYKLMIAMVSKIDARTVAKWMKKGEAFDKFDLSTPDKLMLGTKLIDLMLEANPGYFKVEAVWSRAAKKVRTTRCLLPDDKYTRYIRNTAHRQQFERPWLLPMVHPPKDWSIADDVHGRLSDDTPTADTGGLLQSHERPTPPGVD